MGQLSGIKISTPTFNEVVPSTKQKVKLTPFRVGDEKVLLMASQSKDTKQMLNALKTVIENCVSGVDVEKLAPFDLEYLFLKLRAVSVGETSEIGVACKECNTSNKIVIDLTKVSVKENKNHTNIIKIDKDLIFEMKYPDTNALSEDDLADVEKIFDLIASSVTKVFHGENVYEVSEVDKEDLKDILNSLSTKQFEMVQDFFTTMPKLAKDIIFTCSHCKTENKSTIEGLSSFF